MNNKEFYEQALLSAFSGLMVQADINEREAEFIANFAHEYAIALKNKRNQYLS